MRNISSKIIVWLIIVWFFFLKSLIVLFNDWGSIVIIFIKISKDVLFLIFFFVISFDIYIINIEFVVIVKIVLVINRDFGLIDIVISFLLIFIDELLRYIVKLKFCKID